MQIPIDFVVTWVDDTDPVWREKRAKYSGKQNSRENCAARYRDWDTLRYWFRGVEKFAPWVRTVYFVTDDQKPDWLNTEHPKLKWVRHRDYIPERYLPTFTSDCIEWNFHRIEGLSENFVNFNDDVFLIAPTQPEDFFRDGLPCDRPCPGFLYPDGFFSYAMFNNMMLLNRNFSLKQVMRQHGKKWRAKQDIAGLARLLLYARGDSLAYSANFHIHANLKKSVYETLWETEHDAIDHACLQKFRTRDALTTYCVRDWQLLTGQFTPHKPIGKLFHTCELEKSNAPLKYIREQKGKVVCLNDTENEQNFEQHKQAICKEMERLFPERSQFEKA